jgi:cytochrome c oxidase cbb3-type subunit 4
MLYEDMARLAGVTSLIWFGAIFIAVIVYAFWPRNQARFDAAARMPLRED